MTGQKIVYCETEADITAALTDIGTGAGTILLTSGTITLTGEIQINGGGSYVIKGMGNNSIIDCGGNNKAFDITSADSCVLKDFKILCNDITDTTAVIDVNEATDGPVVISNIMIDGTGNGEDAYGIHIQQGYATIENCQIKEVRRAIEVVGNYNIIDNCIINDIDVPAVVGDATPGNECRAINISGNYNIVSENTINSIDAGDASTGTTLNGAVGGACYGIYSSGNVNKIMNNKIKTLTAGNGSDGTGDGSEGGAGGAVYGIYSSGVDCIIVGNTIENINSGNGGDHDLGLEVTDGPGGDAGQVYGLYNIGNYTMFASNQIKDLNGGYGGKGWTLGNGSSGGDGGGCYGIYNDGGEYGIISNNIMNDFDGGASNYHGEPNGTPGSCFGITVKDATDCVINANNGYDFTEGAGGDPTGPYGLQDTGTADYNIWTSNNFRSLNEAVTGANNIEADNIT